MKKVYIMFLLTMLASLVSINSNAQCCDLSGYTEPGPCLDAVCAIDSFCCDVSWDSVCASEAAATEECQDCLCGCYDNDLDGYTNCDGDCDDFDPNISPAADEICDNGIDDDCDGTVDVVPNACDQAGYNTPGACLDVVCAADSFCCDVAWDSLCASEAAATEECQDCICGCYDNDLDGFTNCDGDCNDFDLDVNPLAIEVCNGIDDNCDGTIDENAVCGTVNVTFSVNMQGLTIAPEGVIVAFSFNGYSEVAMTDADLDGIYVTTQAVPANSSFNYIYGNGPSFLETVPVDCGTDIGFGIILRSLAVAISNVVLDPVCFSGCSNCVPLNDACADATTLTCGASVNGSTVSATPDVNAISCSGITVTSPGVWYTFTGTGAIAEVSTCGGSDLGGDTKIHVYEGNCATPVCVGADDDSCDNPGGFLSTLSFLTTDGTTYYVLVSEYGTLGSGVNFTISLTCTAPPANDDCADATPITCGSAVAGSTFGASSDAEAIDCDFDDVTSPGVWYSIEGTGGSIALSTCSGVDGDTKIHVYTGNCANLVCETSNDDDCGFLSGVTFASTPSTLYYVLVSEYDSGEGIDFVLDATCICDDLDMDGFTDCDGDCDDFDENINPGAIEICNGIDDNCDGNIDEGLALLTYYTDADGDGYGSSLLGDFCIAPANSSVSDGDCDDSDASINPDAIELCNGTDDNCDGNIDEGQAVLTYYEDADGDGYGSALLGDFCIAPANSSVTDGDCDDSDGTINPDATELCNGIDDNCDGNIDEGLAVLTYYADADGDGYGSSLLGDFCIAPANSSVTDGDCDDADFDVNPGATEIDGNGVDDNCDGEVDFPTCCDAPGYSEAGPCLDAVCASDSFCCDVAWDSVCASEAAATEECQECICGCYDNDLDGFTNCDGDCDDFDENINPGASELCNGIDDNCDGNIDEGLAVLTYYEDADGDGYGSALLGDFCIAPANSSVTDGDCDDSDGTINPDATELCNGIDDNCDGNIDEGLAVLTYYADADGDGYGSALLGDFCIAPANSSVTDGDCDDADFDVNPGATEIDGNGVDDDCDGEVDFPTCCDAPGYSEAGPCLDAVCAADSFCCDVAWDSVCASEAAATEECQECICGCYDNDLDGFTNCDGDCDDFDENINPGASELCNGIDDNCDGNIDEGLAVLTYYADADGDGYGSTLLGDFCIAPANSSVIDGDCDDADAAINPDAIELCNGTDDNCNGNIDEGLAVLTYYEDADGDEYGSTLLGDFCIAPANSSVIDGDCDDADFDVNPGATEIDGNGVDDDCDGEVDFAVCCDAPGYSEAGACLDAVCTADSFCCDVAWDSVCASEAAATEECQECICGCYDNDLDGFTNCDGDCDDFDENINPGATELCNGIDDNCDGNIDEGLALTYYADADGDGYGSSLLGDFCIAPLNSSVIDGDCDDADASINPDAIELCNGIDDNCDGNIDEGLAVLTYYEDADGDGYGSALLGDFCIAPANSSVIDGDCDDADADVNPGATEIDDNGVDDDCDGEVDFPSACCDAPGYSEAGACLDAVCTADSFCCDVAWDSVCASEAAATEECQECICGCYDNDLDGFTNCDGDCDDFDENINPGATELCNGIDDNCDGSVDEGATGIIYYSDNDNDGFGSALLGTFCVAPPNSSLNSLDCDDTDAQINPGATELCNGFDDNCNGNTDEGLAVLTYYADFDGDGFGAALLGDFCSPPANSSVTDGDCDDDNAAVNPDASELCNGVDDDCDGDTDEGLELLTYYADVDADGFGGELLGDFCSQPSGSSLIDGDCDDLNEQVHPGANELCNGIDDDCDGETDEDAGGIEYFADADADGYGSTSLGLFCTQPAGSSAQDGDCDDTNAAINPGAAEVCNDIDDDCDGETDENVVFQDYYLDSDGDGYGSELLGNLCAQPDNASLNGDDCDDSNPNIHPGATEQCNGIDDNCDGNTDEGLLLTYYADSDDDGYGNADEMQMSCDPVAGYVLNDGDCDDSNSSVYPGAIEFCNDIDDDCDGVVDDNCIVSVEENAWNWYVNLYPNPANDQLTIRIDGSQGVFSYSVIDALGKMVYQSTLPVQNQTSTFDCSGLSQGTYTVMISQGNQVVYKKFIKM